MIASFHAFASPKRHRRFLPTTTAATPPEPYRLQPIFPRFPPSTFFRSRLPRLTCRPTRWSPPTMLILFIRHRRCRPRTTASYRSGAAPALSATFHFLMPKYECLGHQRVAEYRAVRMAKVARIFAADRRLEQHAPCTTAIIDASRPLISARSPHSDFDYITLRRHISAASLSLPRPVASMPRRLPRKPAGHFAISFTPKAQQSIFDDVMPSRTHAG